MRKHSKPRILLNPVKPPQGEKEGAAAAKQKARLRAPSALHIAQDLRLLSIMLRASLSLEAALAALMKSSQNPTLRTAYKQILHRLQAGGNISSAFAPFTHIFSPLGIALIQLSAESSSLPVILDVLSSYFHTLAKNRSNIRKLLFYPMFVLLSILCAFVLIAIVVIPPFFELFTGLGEELPLSTYTLLAASSLLEEYWWVGLSVLGVLVLLGGLSLGQKNVFYRLALSLSLRLPLLGRLLLYRELWGYFLGFFYLYQARIDLHKSLPIALTSLQNPALKRAISRASELVEQGLGLDRSFATCPYIDTTLQSFLAAGQNSGELAQVLELCAQYCQDIYEQQTSRIQALIEPCSTIIIALFVSWLAFGIFLPIWELGSINL